MKIFSTRRTGEATSPKECMRYTVWEKLLVSPSTSVMGALFNLSLNWVMSMMGEKWALTGNVR